MSAVSPSSPLKTHYMGILLTILSVVSSTLQNGSIPTVNLENPTTWGIVLGFIWTIIGLIRNKPQGTPIN